eukprot:s2133_g17.t1
METLEQGNAPTGNVACVLAQDAVQLRALADTHQINTDLALVLVDVPVSGGPDHGVSARAYGWHVNNSSKEEAVIGFFKAPVTDGASIIQRSGWKNGFYQRLGENSEAKDPIKWLVRGEKPANAYLAEARTLAKQHKVGLVLRRGGRNNLGLLGVKPEEDDSKRRRRWAVKGVPNGWGPADFSQVLDGHFQAFGDITPPGHKGGIWTFKGVWSGSGNASCKVLDIGAVRPLVISPWLPAPPKKPNTEPLWGAKGWLTRQKGAENSTPEQKDEEMPEEVPATIPDETQSSQTTQEQAQSNKKGPDGTSNGSPEKKKLKTDNLPGGNKNKVFEDLDKLGPDGVPMWDLGGFGDCGFRCLVAVQSLRNEKKQGHGGRGARY